MIGLAKTVLHVKISFVVKQCELVVTDIHFVSHEPETQTFCVAGLTFTVVSKNWKYSQYSKSVLVQIPDHEEVS
jgi:hypothetical protein